MWLSRGRLGAPGDVLSRVTLRAGRGEQGDGVLSEQRQLHDRRLHGMRGPEQRAPDGTESLRLHLHGLERVLQEFVPGGVFQYGCGTASDLATSVQTGASGKPTLPLVQTSISLTQPASSLSRSSSAPSSSQSASSSSSTASSSPPATSSGTPTSSQSPANPASSTPAAPPTSNQSGPGYNRTGAIVGGTIGGLALLAALLALLFCCLRRRRNRRRGPGPDPATAPTSEYTSPVRSHGAAFAPLPTWQEEEEPQITPPARHNQPYHQYEHPPTAAAGNVARSAGGNGGGYGSTAPVSAVSPNTPVGGGDGRGGWPLAYGAAHVPGGGRGHTPIANEYLNNNSSSNNNYNNGSGGAGAVVTPLTPYHSNNPHAFSNDWTHQGFDKPMNQNNQRPSREIDDFSRDVSATMRHVQDSDTEPLTAGSSMHNYPIDGPGTGPGGEFNPNMLQPYQNRQLVPGSSGSMTSTSSYTPSRRGDRPLWQQTRRQSRNLMWL
ncbi:hypothetical protein PG993_002467 [Apiospora rasikravindrae]|uniref:Uncharacterized protein n=1 Tax=Apiospora rasikravindrae TaxID=990691 RepID=A0ABR1TX54_9PEZI